MDRLLGSVINDYNLYKIIEGIIAILSLVMIYLGIQIALTWRSLKKEGAPGEIIAQQGNFFWSSVFIFIAGLFMLIHEFFENLEKNAPDYTTYEMFEMIALLGLVLFFYEWNKILKNLKKKDF
ncbi:MAG: hypothetical protein O8C64_06315 [Candidatus Methanoperedens sp.]|nr:hypothetical protein [Candidatus Methanoperedens sp.]MCZ7403381.1 hypothetical protein [Candidatus Methanoperedens sp.]